jgi:hypothetical protein
VGKQIECIDDELAEWIGRQRVFFVATAPLDPNGHVNCSPKGGDCFRVTGPREAAYQDYTGSGAETSAHLAENGRIVVMFCSFDPQPRIARLHGRGEVFTPGLPGFERFAPLFPQNPGTRAIIRIDIARVSTSCGFGVPFMEFREERDTLEKWARSKGSEGLAEYRATKNAVSIDGLPALGAAEGQLRPG